MFKFSNAITLEKSFYLNGDFVRESQITVHQSPEVVMCKTFTIVIDYL